MGALEDGIGACMMRQSWPCRERKLCLPLQEATDTASRLHSELQAARSQVQKLQAAAEVARQASEQQNADIQVQPTAAVRSAPACRMQQALAGLARHPPRHVACGPACGCLSLTLVRGSLAFSECLRCS